MFRIKSKLNLNSHQVSLNIFVPADAHQRPCLMHGAQAGG